MPVWLSGSGIPDATLGSSGDYYIDTDSKKVYQRLDGVWTVSGFVTEYGDMPEEIYKLRKEFNSMVNHLNNLLGMIENGILQETDYTDRLAELRQAIEKNLLALQKTDYNLI